MQRGTVLVGLAAAALVGGGLWLGRASSATADAPAPSASATVRAASLPAPAARAPRAPVVLPARTTTIATPGLTADLTASDPKVRRAAVREAARDDGLDPAVLLMASRDPDLEVGFTAMAALGKRYADGSVTASDMIARATDRTLDDRVRGSALNGLGVVAAPEAAALFVDLLAHGSVTERATAAILLVHQDPEVAMPALIAALGDADDHVKTNVLESLRSRSRGRDFGTDTAAWQAWWRSQPR